MMTEKHLGLFLQKLYVEDFIRPGMISPCWVWNGTRNRQGYGTFTINRTLTINRATALRVHRAAYELWVGPIPNGLVIDHLCRNPPCMCPEHLEAVTQQINVSRATLFNSTKTVCPKGHLYDLANTCVIQLPSGRSRRVCRSCNRERVKLNYARMKQSEPILCLA